MLGVCGPYIALGQADIPFHKQNFRQPTEASRGPLDRLTLSRQRPVCVDVAGAVARVQKIGRLTRLVSRNDLERCTERVSDVSQKLYTMGKAH